LLNSVPRTYPATTTTAEKATALSGDLTKATQFRTTLRAEDQASGLLTIARDNPALMRSDYAVALFKQRWDTVNQLEQRFAEAKAHSDAKRYPSAFKEILGLMVAYDDWEHDATRAERSRLLRYAGALRATMEKERAKVVPRKIAAHLAAGRLQSAGDLFDTLPTGSADTDPKLGNLHSLLALAQKIAAAERTPRQWQLLALSEDPLFNELLELTNDGETQGYWHTHFSSAWRTATDVNGMIGKVEVECNARRYRDARTMLSSAKSSYGEWKGAERVGRFAELELVISNGLARENEQDAQRRYGDALKSTEKAILGGGLPNMPSPPSTLTSSLRSTGKEVQALLDTANRIQLAVSATPPSYQTLVSLRDATQAYGQEEASRVQRILRQRRWGDRFDQAMKKAEAAKAEAARLRRLREEERKRKEEERLREERRRRKERERQREEERKRKEKEEEEKEDDAEDTWY
jgi:hypothetical protein